MYKKPRFETTCIKKPSIVTTCINNQDFEKTCIKKPSMDTKCIKLTGERVTYDVLPAPQGGAMHLRNRGGGQRGGIKEGKRLVERLVKLAFDEGFDVREWREGYAILQFHQLGNPLRGHHVGARTQVLPQFDLRPTWNEHTCKQTNKQTNKHTYK